MTADIIRLKLNVPLRGKPKGATIRVQASGGVPLDRYWRARLKDAKIDGCLEVLNREAPKKKAAQKEGSNA